ncbi:hypothetical protein MM300_16375 [Evansella sp. LMS18]|uniref:hypothetical protein n=1 Tax=Evansella sp. LMS18 TaxID=2924033 RepID=UPI0020D034A7|nr:hypothetical protein [Evansella sp. LMS18]UTR09459.1 hypothetical protein MM300_16375 [Evansella sp. LMS18]
MNKEIIKLADGISASCYQFSDHVMCLEVMKDGEPMGSFCSTVSQYEEWDEEEVTALIQSHVRKFEESARKQKAEEMLVLDDLVIRYYNHSEDLFCVDITKDGKPAGSFCADRSSFEEWMEDKDMLSEVIREMSSL